MTWRRSRSGPRGRISLVNGTNVPGAIGSPGALPPTPDYPLRLAVDILSALRANLLNRRCRSLDTRDGENRLHHLFDVLEEKQIATDATPLRPLLHPAQLNWWIRS